jgi:hypothetical protein
MLATIHFEEPWMAILFWIAIAACLGTNLLFYLAILVVRRNGGRASLIIPFQTFRELHAIAQRTEQADQRSMFLRIRSTFYLCSAVFVLLFLVFALLAALSIVRFTFS